MSGDWAREREAAERIARLAGEEILRRWRPTGQERVEVKGRERDLVTEADRAAEALILEHLRREFPGDGIVAEETSPEFLRAGRVWVVDPLDGTVNFAHGIPQFSVSIGIMEEGVPRAGCVHAPVLRETYAASFRGGATLDGAPIRVSAQEDLRRALLVTGFPYRRNEDPRNNMANFVRLALHCRGVRRFGSAALDLASVAAGRLDGYWELWLSPWDVCAGICLVTEAGGRVTGIHGKGDPVEGETILATNGRIHAALDGMLEGI
ncbi:MAG: inositol monophosphatase [Planctomycetes bacterium]|nr:inositol monophosphatase [Planctomycetota bacterium]